MNRPGFHRRLLAVHCLSGLGDSLTGALLVFAPAWTLTLLGVRQPPRPLAFISFIGVFVLSVGLAYLWTARLPMRPANSPHWQMTWVFTALVRTLVATYLIFTVATGRMEFSWLTVALVDGTWAGVQWTGLHRGWLDFTN